MKIQGGTNEDRKKLPTPDSHMDGEKGTKTTVYNTKRDSRKREEKKEKEKKRAKGGRKTTVKRKSSILLIILLRHV